MSTSKTSCLDAVDSPPPAPAPITVVRRHHPDIENLLDQVISRVTDILSTEQPRYAFMNPIATVICTEPTKQFFRAVRKRQSEWCQRSGTTFGRRTTRKAKNWVMPEGSSSKHDRFLQRSLCFTGILFVDGIIVPPHEWSRIESAANDYELA
jgi:hypothetical protein